LICAANVKRFGENMTVKSGWLHVKESSKENSVVEKTRWCVLENGVLWLFK